MNSNDLSVCQVMSRGPELQEELTGGWRVGETGYSAHSASAWSIKLSLFGTLGFHELCLLVYYQFILAARNEHLN